MVIVTHYKFSVMSKALVLPLTTLRRDMILSKIARKASTNIPKCMIQYHIRGSNT